MTAVQGAMSAAERSMRSVFVGNIPYEATEEQLKDIFCEVGPVVSFRLVYDRETGKPKGYGFCEYKDQEMALSAMRNLNGYELNGRALRVDNAASEKSKEELKNLQASLGGPPVESPFGEEVSPEHAPERIAKIMSSLPPEQLYQLMIEMKQCIENNPNESRTLLIQNPQLTYALLQALVVMKIVEPQAAMAMLHGKNGAGVPLGLLPTPEANQIPNPPIPSLPVREVGHYGQPVPAMNEGMNSVPPFQNIPQRVPVPTNPAANPLRGPGLSPQKTPLLGGAPLPAPPIPPMVGPFQDRGDPRMLGDHDLRAAPMPGDHDMRQPPMMATDKDLRHPMGDHDFRTLNVPPRMQDNRGFPDPRYRNAPGPPQEMLQNQRSAYGGGNRPNFDGRGIGMSPRMEESRSPAIPPASNSIPGRMTNPRMVAPSTGSPMINTASPSSVSSPRPGNPLAATAAAIAPHDQEKAQLIMQVLQLSDQQIALLPDEQRHSIMVLKEQIARSTQAT